MEHELAHSLLSDYLDGNLPDEAARDLESHLEQCTRCRADLDLLRRALEMIHRLPPVEAPAGFSAQLKRRARKSGLFKSSMSKAGGRTLVPFEAIMAVLLAAMGALVIFLLVFYSELQTLEVDRPPVALLVTDNREVNLLAGATWEAGGEVRALGRKVPRQSPLGGSPELELIIPPEGWPGFVEVLGEAAQRAGLPARPAPVSRDGRVHVIVQIRTKRPPGAAGTSSSQALPRTPPGPPPPPPGGKGR